MASADAVPCCCLGLREFFQLEHPPVDFGVSDGVGAAADWNVVPDDPGRRERGGCGRRCTHLLVVASAWVQGPWAGSRGSQKRVTPLVSDSVSGFSLQKRARGQCGGQAGLSPKRRLDGCTHCGAVMVLPVGVGAKLSTGDPAGVNQQVGGATCWRRSLQS